MAHDLACGDFNGDGYADSLFKSYQGNTCGAAASSQGIYMDGRVYLWILSGKDGATLRIHPFNEENLYGGSPGSELGVTNVGDVNGDGADDLVYRTNTRDSDYSDGSNHMFSGYEEMQWSLVVCSGAQDSILNSIPVTPLFKMGYTFEAYGTMLPADVDADGHPEVIIGIYEPSMPSYDPDALQ